MAFAEQTVSSLTTSQGRFERKLETLRSIREQQRMHGIPGLDGGEDGEHMDGNADTFSDTNSGAYSDLRSRRSLPLAPFVIR